MFHEPKIDAEEARKTLSLFLITDILKVQSYKLLKGKHPQKTIGLIPKPSWTLLSLIVFGSF